VKHSSVSDSLETALSYFIDYSVVTPCDQHFMAEPIIGVALAFGEPLCRI